uniref:Uncharacterized protein n=1 Tax=Anguilla anguilla TaxID=7936 RepID=A0A0E9TUR5_ANGAN
MLFHETVYNTRWLKELKGTLTSLKLINSLSRHSKHTRGLGAVVDVSGDHW